MKLTLSWLKSHLETEATLDEIVAALTRLGLEVDAVVDRAAELAPFKVAYVVSAAPHPQADRLQVCMVDTGEKTLQVVCGAPNARTGMKGVFAPGGSTIPRTGMVLKPSVIRGVESNGMLCSGYELGVSEDHTGIIEVPDEVPLGTPFAALAGLDDPMLDVKITANRADCLGVRGIARDLAAAGVGRLKPLAVDQVPGRYPSPITVTIDDTHACPLFIGRWIRGVKNGPSPKWLQDRLTSIGLRPISALVDITNFTTFDLDRPLHVFDGGKIKGNLLVRPAKGGETIAALNGKDYTLDAGMTVIEDETGVISLGGVIGGLSTGCDETTTDVFIEAALFDPVRTAATGRALNLQSDARYRFERGLDPAFVPDAMEIATRLVLNLCGGEAGEVMIAGAVPEWERTLTLRPGRVESLGGVAVPSGEIVATLEALGCITRWEGDRLVVIPPSWRADIEGEADLVEEVLRLKGYDAIPTVSLPRATALPAPALDPRQRREAMVRRTLAGRGLDEAVTYSFMEGALLARTDIFGQANPALALANPISTDLDVMRPTVLPNLLAAAQRNADRFYRDVALFELGPQYTDDTPEGQSTVAAGVRVGRARLKSWNEAERGADAFDAKADALAALAVCGIAADAVQVTADAPGWYHPGRSGQIKLGPKTVLARFGEIHPRLLRALDLAGPAAGFEVMLDTVPLAKPKPRAALKLSPLQPVERDFAFVVDASVTAELLLRAARGVDKKLVASVRLFDAYAGPGVPEGKKSLAITVTLQPVEATLTEAEIEAFSNALVAAVAKATGGVLRG
ncbi:MAG TPA: phenylalanine--tRNA ligase subunit beta [Stellaceae bacterium]|nr:phenylalanine--tRNA ligase subunit beta [Stellaceae bacterium]